MKPQETLLTLETVLILPVILPASMVLPAITLEVTLHPSETTLIQQEIPLYLVKTSQNPTETAAAIALATPTCPLAMRLPVTLLEMV